MGAVTTRQGAIATADWAQMLATDAFVSLRGHVLRGEVDEPELAAFGAHWDDLSPDTELPDGGSYRYRRYGRLAAAAGPHGFELSPLPHAAFQQSAETIPHYRGKARRFDPIPAAVLRDPVLTRLVSVDLAIVAARRPASRWLVGLHMVRVVARQLDGGRPTPEGRHHDGHDFVGMHLIGRRGCVGGDSIIYRPGHPPVRMTLAEPLDSLVVDDGALTHEVTSIGAADRLGVRDMLLIDLNMDHTGEGGVAASGTGVPGWPR
jgi:hypothetical protein